MPAERRCIGQSQGPFLFEGKTPVGKSSEKPSYTPVLKGLIMHELYTIFRKIVDELGLRENIYGYSIILTVLTIPIIILLICLAKLLRFLNKMCDKNN